MLSQRRTQIGRAIIGAIVVIVLISLLIKSAGVTLGEGYRTILTGAFGSFQELFDFVKGKKPPPIPLDYTLYIMTILLIAGLSVAIALQAGLFNIGAEGQILVGACVAAWVGFNFQIAAPWHLLLTLAAGALAGALWAFIPVLLKVGRGAHEVITTIMFNYIALYLTHWLVTDFWKDPTTGATQTPPVHPTAYLPVLKSFQYTSWGLPLGVLFAVLLWLVLDRTVWGYELRAVGANRDAAEASGVPVKRRMVMAFLLAGALAGLAGAVQVCGSLEHNFYEGFSAGYGFDSIAVSLMAGNHPAWVVGTSWLFSALRNGADALGSKEIAIIVQGVLIIYIAALRLRRGRLEG